jgi:hypothetical protein
MKPLLHYGPAGRITRRGDHHTIDGKPCVNESEEKDARVREGVALKDRTGMRRSVLPQVFAGYGNGPFLMPSLR